MLVRPASDLVGAGKMCHLYLGEENSVTAVVIITAFALIAALLMWVTQAGEERSERGIHR